MKLKNLTRTVSIFATITVLFLTTQCRTKTGENPNNEKWFPKYDFNASQFKEPAQEFGPFARWWWPGNDVEKDELKREINLFADNGFAGVEIQPFNINVPMPSEDVRNRVLSWDTPGFYSNVKAVLEEAKKKGIIVDMNNGSGWPVGGPYLKAKDGMLTLVHASIDIEGGSDVSVKIPGVYNPTDIPSNLIAVVGAKIAPKNKKLNRRTTALDPSSTIVLTDKVKNDSLNWKFPEENWKLIAFWSRPQSLIGSMVAAPEQGPVLNHFDEAKVFESYEYLFGERTGLSQYYGDPLRAVFNDSYEFAVDRFYSSEFIDYFKEKRGYNITPWLATNMQKKYNYVEYKNPHRAPTFYFGSQDWRVRYDYDLTISELFGKNFIGAGSEWLEQRGMLHRSQVYGLRMDMIANAGLASIPETESMLGPEANLKIMASGAHLYNRPVLTAEAVVFAKRGYMTTPQKIRIVADKLFSAGVNQIVYHGVPYRYVNEETTELGWYPFYMGKAVAFSSHLGKGTQFWKYQKELNEYVARTQYALRSGKPHVDVLIYYPFMTVEGMPDNPEEILSMGYMPDVEPPLRSVEDIPKEKAEWTRKVYPVINRLEADGITWEWVNDESIQAAKLDGDQQINIRGNSYQALMLVGSDVIRLNSAKHISKLVKKGMKFAVVGDFPSKQPSFLNWEENDKATAQLIKKSCNEANSKHFQDNNDLGEWIDGLNKTVRFNDKYDFTRQVEREMSDGSRIQFIWNKSDKWRPVSLTLDKKYKKACWLNAENGTISSVNKLNDVSYVLPPYSTIILHASTNNRVEDSLLSTTPNNIYQAESVLDIKNWNIKSGEVSIENTPLFDWKNNEQLKLTSAEGVYKASFNVSQVDNKSAYLIDLGKVCFTAEVLINGQFVGNRIYAPYLFNISGVIEEGENTIEVHITPGALNGLIGESEKGNPKYSRFKNRTDDLMSAGLVGPVVLYKK